MTDAAAPPRALTPAKPARPAFSGAEASGTTPAATAPYTDVEVLP